MNTGWEYPHDPHHFDGGQPWHDPHWQDPNWQPPPQHHRGLHFSLKHLLNPLAPLGFSSGFRGGGGFRGGFGRGAFGRGGAWGHRFGYGYGRGGGWEHYEPLFNDVANDVADAVAPSFGALPEDTASIVDLLMRAHAGDEQAKEEVRAALSDPHLSALYGAVQSHLSAHPHFDHFAATANHPSDVAPPPTGVPMAPMDPSAAAHATYSSETPPPAAPPAASGLIMHPGWPGYGAAGCAGLVAPEVAGWGGGFRGGFGRGGFGRGRFGRGGFGARPARGAWGGHPHHHHHWQPPQPPPPPEEPPPDMDEGPPPGPPPAASGAHGGGGGHFGRGSYGGSSHFGRGYASHAYGRGYGQGAWPSYDEDVDLADMAPDGGPYGEGAEQILEDQDTAEMYGGPPADTEPESWHTHHHWRGTPGV